MRTAEVVIIGGGIVGSSIAYHLTAAGCKNVVVIERESSQGKGSTGKSMGGVRAQFSTPVNIQMSLYSIPFYAAFDQALGYPCGYRAQGYLFCATNAEHLAYLRTNFEKQVAMGLKDVRLVNAGEIRKLFPQVTNVDLEYAWYGSIGMTDTHLPRYHRLAPQVLSVSGYNGRGIAAGTVFGQMLAKLILKEIEECEMPLPCTGPQAAKFRSVRSLYYSLGSQIAHLADARLV